MNSTMGIPTLVSKILANEKSPANSLAGLFNMARSGGFEPPTAWFVARYSIQLSYERAKLFSKLRSLNCMAVREGFEPLPTCRSPK